jgi:Fe2+ transport system protein FeoA
LQLRNRGRHGQRENWCLDIDGNVPLVCLKEGVRAVMTHSSGNGNVVRRLSEMGLTPGCELRILRKCGFRGPVEIQVRGASLALGYDLASQIFVQESKAASDAV